MKFLPGKVRIPLEINIANTFKSLISQGYSKENAQSAMEISWLSVWIRG